MPPLVGAPSHLPNPEAHMLFNISEKKREIFNQARERIRDKAQYTNDGRMPWTQITVSLPIESSDTTCDEDLAVVWALMQHSTRSNPKVNGRGDLTWEIWANPCFLEWLGIDPETTKPVDKCIHPVQYYTGAVKLQRLEKQFKRLVKEGGDTRTVKQEIQKVENAAANAQHRNHYHWSEFGECIVIYKKDQSKKKVKELKLTVKMRTAYVGTGDPRSNNGYLRSCGIKELLDPNSDTYRLLDRCGI